MIATLAPKADFVDRFVEADGLYGYQTAGRALGCKPNKFINWLKLRYCFYAGSDLVPYSTYVDQKLFVVKNTVGTDDKAHARGFVTAKGIEYFRAACRLKSKFTSRPLRSLRRPRLIEGMAMSTQSHNRADRIETLSRGKPGVVERRFGAQIKWLPTINGIPASAGETEDDCFDFRVDALAAARRVKDHSRYLIAAENGAE